MRNPGPYGVVPLVQKSQHGKSRHRVEKFVMFGDSLATLFEGYATTRTVVYIRPPMVLTIIRCPHMHVRASGAIPCRGHAHDSWHPNIAAWRLAF